MAHLVAFIASHDDALKTQVVRLLRSGAVPVTVIDEAAARQSAALDLALVDARSDWTSAMSAIERMRASMPGAGIFTIARSADPTAILEAMRAGANEFFTWPAPPETFHEAIRRAAARRDTTPGARTATTLVFFGSKGGTGTTTIGVNCAVELARLSKRPTVILDLRPGLGEVGLFLDVRPKYTLLDALDNLQRLDREFLRELVATHKSSLDVLAGSDHFDRPSASDAPAFEELLRFLSKQYDYVVIDAGNQMDACAIAALYAADKIFLVATPDVPSVRNSQRVLHRVEQLGACSERVRFLLNRAAEPLPIPLKQIEGAVGYAVHHTFPSDYKAVSAALNSGVPLALSGNSTIATQFDLFTRGLLNPGDVPEPESGKQGLTLARVASLW